MADSKISDLSAVTNPASTDVVPIVNSSTTKKVTIANLVANSAPATLTVGTTLTSSGTTVLTGVTTQSVGGTTSALTDLLINPATKASGNLIEADVNSASKFSVGFAGLVTSAGGFTTPTGQTYTLSNGFAIAASNTSKANISNTGGTGLAAFVLGVSSEPTIIGTAPTHQQAATIIQSEELLTIAASPTSTTSMQIPAGAVVLAVSVRVTTVIPTAATFTVTVGGTTCNTVAVPVAATTTNVGTAGGHFYNSTAQGVVITPNLQPGDNTGRVRVTVVYMVITPPTS